jgi:Mg2+-importing ATPase
VSAFVVLIRQRRSALLGLLTAAAAVSYFVGEHTDAHGHRGHPHDQLGRRFANEHRAERAVARQRPAPGGGGS